MGPLFMFDPARVQPQKPPTETIFYDGHCGLCHWAVRLVLAHDRSGDAFRFAPLDSDAFRAAVSEADRAALPDTFVLRTADGTLLIRSAAVLHLWRRLGGRWRLLAVLAGVIPAPLRDRIYDGVAQIRHRLFRRPPTVCPVVPEHLRTRFEV